MARNYRLSTTDLLALSRMPRAFEIIAETIDEEVRKELESFAGHRLKRDSGSLMQKIRDDEGYYIYAYPTQEIGCYLGYEMNYPDGYPKVQVGLWTEQGGDGSEVSIAAVKYIADHQDWEGSAPDVWREVSLADFLSNEDHVSAVKHFFIESIRQLREELTEFKKENPDLPWSGGS